jgi:hypothetical protein
MSRWHEVILNLISKKKMEMTDLNYFQEGYIYPSPPYVYSDAKALYSKTARLDRRNWIRPRI